MLINISFRYMHGGLFIENNDYHLNIDNIMEINNINFYVSGNVIPEIQEQDETKILKNIIEIIKRRNIGLVIDLSNYNNDFPKQQVFGSYDIVYYGYKIRDSSIDLSDSSEQHLESVIKTIITIIPKIRKHVIIDKRNVLIHCYVGQNRSQLLFIAYMLLVHDLSYYDVRVELMKNRNQFIISNPLFIALLYHISFNRDKYRMLMNLKILDPDIKSFVNEIKEYLFEKRTDILETEGRIYKQYINGIVKKSLHKNLDRLNILLHR